MATPSNLVKCIAGSIFFELVGLSKLLITDYKRSAKRVKTLLLLLNKQFIGIVTKLIIRLAG